MKVVKRWQDQDCPDGFPNIFELDDSTYVFASEKRLVWRDEGGDLLNEAYKSPFKIPPSMDLLDKQFLARIYRLNTALDEAYAMEPLPFDDSLREMWERCIDTSRGY